MLGETVRKTKQKLAYLLIVSAALLQVGAVIPEPICRTMVRGEIYYFIAHIVCYGAMAFLIALFLRFQRHVLNIKMTDAAAIAAAFMLTACFGALTELSQALPFIDRRPSWNDYECNLVGAVA